MPIGKKPQTESTHNEVYTSWNQRMNSRLSQNEITTNNNSNAKQARLTIDDIVENRNMGDILNDRNID